MKQYFDIAISPATICKLLKTYVVTHNKIRQVNAMMEVANQCNDTLSGALLAQTIFFKRDMLTIWVDETGTNKRDQLRKYGYIYGLSGATPKYHRFLTRGDRVNATAAITSSSPLALELTKSNVNGND